MRCAQVTTQATLLLEDVPLLKAKAQALAHYARERRRRALLAKVGRWLVLVAVLELLRCTVGRQGLRRVLGAGLLGPEAEVASGELAVAAAAGAAQPASVGEDPPGVAGFAAAEATPPGGEAGHRRSVLGRRALDGQQVRG